MTRRSKRELERTVEELSGSPDSVTLGELLRADDVSSTGKTDKETPIWRVNGVEKHIPKRVRGDFLRITLGGDPKNHNPPAEALADFREGCS
jgi:hypothetical protein